MNVFDKNFQVLEAGLNAYSVRSKALANNIANINTPNYKRQDVQFKKILKEALKKSDKKLYGTTTNKHHIPINRRPSLNNFKPKVIMEKNTKTRFDKNNVDIDRENAEFAKNNIRYQFAVRRMTQQFQLIKMALKAR